MWFAGCIQMIFFSMLACTIGSQGGPNNMAAANFLWLHFLNNRSSVQFFVWDLWSHPHQPLFGACSRVTVRIRFSPIGAYVGPCYFDMEHSVIASKKSLIISFEVTTMRPNIGMVEYPDHSQVNRIELIWAIIVKFDQIRKNLWRISCAEILGLGKKFFAASSVKKMSRFEEVSPEEIKRIAWKFTKTVILLGLARYELIITNSAYGLVGYIYQLISGASSKNNC